MVLSNKVEHLTLLSESVLLLWRWDGFAYLMDISDGIDKPKPIQHPFGISDRIKAACKDGLILERNHKVGRYVVSSKLTLACISRTRELYDQLKTAGLALETQ